MASVSRTAAAVVLLWLGSVADAAWPQGLTPRERVLSLTDRRVIDPEAWEAALPDGAGADLLLERVVGQGRVGDARLTRSTIEAAARALELETREGGAPAGARCRRRLALALGELDRWPWPRGIAVGSPHLEREAAWMAGQMTATVGWPPAEVFASDRASHSAKGIGDDRIIEDAVEARLYYGWRLKGHPFEDEAFGILADARSPLAHRRAAAYHLMRLAPKERLGEILPHLKDGDPLLAGYIARGLGSIKSERAVGPLVAAWFSHEHRSPRIQILRALGALAHRGGAAAVADALGSGDPHLQRTALEALAAIAADRGLAGKHRRGLVTFVWALLTKDPVEDVRRAAVAALAALDRKNFDRFFAMARLHPSAAVRAAYARALVHVKPLNLERVEVFLGDSDRRVVAAAVESLAASESPHARARLLSVLESARDEVVLALALDGLIGDDAAPGDGARARWWRAVRRAYAAMPPAQAETKQSVLRAAVALDDDHTVPFLERVALDDPEIAIRTMARAHLRELGAPAIPAHRPLPEDASRVRAAAGLMGKSDVTARLLTSRGEITLRLYPRDAPLTVLSFVTLARERFYDGIRFHRVVPDFVAQAGCPRGDGWGGPGRTIRCEINDLSYRRGTLGMALAGKDTGGSQWFIALSPQPHLDGRYTAFGDVAAGFDVLAALVQGDVIESVTVVSK